MSVTVWLTISLCLSFVASEKVLFPKELERCKRNDPQVDECLRKAIQNALPVLSNGIARAGIQPIDPMITRRAPLKQNFGPVKINLTITDLITRGYSNMTIRKVRSKLSDYHFEADATAPRLILNGDYVMKAEVFALPMEGSGSVEAIMDDVDITMKITGQQSLRSGEEYLQISKTPVCFQPKNIKVEFKNLFGGNEKLGRQANAFLNRHVMDVFKAIKDISCRTLSKVAQEFVEPMFQTLPYTEIFP